MNITRVPIKEMIRINGDHIRLDVIVIIGKQGKHYVHFAPSINVSGYGSTEEEAEQSFNLDLDLFFSALQNLPLKKRKIELTKLGFVQNKYHKKNYSKELSDEQEHYQAYEAGTVTTRQLKAII